MCRWCGGFRCARMTSATRFVPVRRWPRREAAGAARLAFRWLREGVITRRDESVNSILQYRYRGFARLSSPVSWLPAGLLSWSCSSTTDPGSATGGAPSASGAAAVMGGMPQTTGGSAPITGGTRDAGVVTSPGGTTSGGGSSSPGGVSTGGLMNPNGGAMSATGGRDGGSGTGGSGGGGPASTGGSGGAATSTCTTSEESKFSFFLLSLRALQRESGSQDGFGGHLKGISGADGICQRVAEHVSPCQKSKVWRAFLSTTTVNAADRIGKGPWHDRRGRLLANTLTDLLKERPAGADPLIANDFPNEDGTPNHNPDGTGPVDNHQTLTGTGVDGKLYTQSTAPGAKGGATSCGDGRWSPEAATCWDWTSDEPKGCPRVGHSWPRTGSGVNWISVWNEGGCAPGVSIVEAGGLDGTRRVGSAGGYGGYYCFAVRP